jgi:ferredoxin
MPVLTFEGEGVVTEVSPGEKIIDVCGRVETSLMFGCQDGNCGTCLIGVVGNPEGLSTMEEAEKEFLDALGAREEERLACQCKVLADVAIEVRG